MPPNSPEHPKYGFVIDNRKCIGCHACSVACKSENEVPLGVNRTWVKNVETGTYPDVRRHFQVTRCNHCEKPPCAEICPTTAMFQRKDGIVEFDRDRCIGCKACLQACPYDAIYLDPETQTAAKCHYCAHRTEIGLEPACVVVCPEHAIIAGDMNDPTTEISRLIAQEKTAVRKPEQKTKPKLHYIDGHEPALRPLTTNEPQSSFVWADVLDHDMVGREAGPHAAEANDPVQFADGTMAEQMVQVAYNAQHKIPWHWPVPAYMVTKGISAGIAMALGAGLMFDLFALTSGAKLVAGTVALVFLFLTTAFLVFDLAKPERFLYIIFKPQWKSWLTRGAYVLILFSLSLTAWTLRHFLIHFELVDPAFMNPLEQPLLIAGAVLGFFTAVYTAFLFAQAEGRDLWQAPLLWVHLAVQAVMLGSGILLLMGWYEGSASDLATLGRQVFLGSLLINVLLNIFGEIGLRPHTEEAKRAAHIMRRGRYAPAFWLGGIVLGGILPALLVLGFSIFPEVTHGMVLTLGVLCSMIGLYAYEYAFVMAPQHVPNS